MGNSAKLLNLAMMKHFMANVIIQPTFWTYDYAQPANGVCGGFQTERLSAILGRAENDARLLLEGTHHITYKMRCAFI